MWLDIKKKDRPSPGSRPRFWWAFERMVVAMMWACTAFLAFVLIYCLVTNSNGVTIAFNMAREQVIETVLLVLITVAGGVVWYRLVR